MAKRTKRQSRPHGRPTGTRPRKRRVLVVSGADVTEPEYFTMLNGIFDSVHFHPVKTDSESNPDAIAERAAQRKYEDRKECDQKDNRAQPYAATYVIADVDHFTEAQFAEARRICKSKNMELVVSNPCFEVWLIDHCRKCPGTATTPKEAQSIAKNKNLICGHHNKNIQESALRNNTATAIKNAEAHNTPGRAIGRSALNNFSNWTPWTDMSELMKKETDA